MIRLIFMLIGIAITAIGSYLVNDYFQAWKDFLPLNVDIGISFLIVGLTIWFVASPTPKA